jgi:hypothetical protein
MVHESARVILFGVPAYLIYRNAFVGSLRLPPVSGKPLIAHCDVAAQLGNGVPSDHVNRQQSNLRSSTPPPI